MPAPNPWKQCEIMEHFQLKFKENFSNILGLQSAKLLAFVVMF